MEHWYVMDGQLSQQKWLHLTRCSSSRKFCTNQVLSARSKGSRYDVDTRLNLVSFLSCDSFTILFFSKNAQSHYLSPWLTCYPGVKWVILSKKRSSIFYTLRDEYQVLGRFRRFDSLFCHNGWCYVMTFS